MRINKINYEQYAIDYLEGTLDGSLFAEMEAFLGQHPDIRKELEEMHLIVLVPDKEVVFGEKEALLRPATEKVRVLPLAWVSALAAIAAMLLVVWVFWGNMQTIPNIPAREVAIENEKQAPSDNMLPVDEIKELPIRPQEQAIEKDGLPQDAIAVQEMAPRKPKPKKKVLPTQVNTTYERPLNSSRPQEATTPITPVARQADPLPKEEQPIAEKPQQTAKPLPEPPSELQSATPDDSEEYWAYVEPIDSKVEATILPKNTSKGLELESPTMNVPSSDKPMMAVNTRGRRLKSWGLLPERSSFKVRMGSLKEAFVPEEFSER